MTTLEKGLGAALVVGVMVCATCCASATSRARLTPADVVTQLVQFHGAVAEQYAAGGMELEHYNQVTAWIASTVRVLQANPRQWEGQARLAWPAVKSICTPFEALNAWTHTIDALVQ